MYYRYKPKKKRRRRIRQLLVILLIGCGVYLGFKYKHYLLFWQYTYNKLESSVKTAYSIKNTDEKKRELERAVKICDDYKLKNSLSPDAYFLAGAAHYKLGEAYLGSSFSNILINSSLEAVNPDARYEFFASIRDIKKALALTGEPADSEYSLVLAKACYLSEYYSAEEIYNILSKIINLREITDPDNIRLYSLIFILNGREKEGLSHLEKLGLAGQSIEGRLFLAAAYKSAKKYTSAIMEYKEVLSKAGEPDMIKLVQTNLGKIYYNQSLFHESLNHFLGAYEFDKNDNTLKIWIGKGYSAIGDKTKAKAILGEVLASDSGNAEVKKLLSLM